MVTKSKVPTFSVLLPTHNRADILSYSIQSVLNQTFDNFELLIVGDGCTDGTERIVNQFVKKDKRIRWFPFPKGKGFGYAHRNTVFKKARGTYIAFVAHDDLWFPDHLEKCYQFLSCHSDYEIVYTRPLWIAHDGTIVPSCLNTDVPSMRDVFLNIRNEIPAQCVVHLRSRAKEAGFMDTNMPEGGDWDMWKRIIRSSTSKKIGFISSPTTLHFRAVWRTKKFYWDLYLEQLYSRINATSTYSKTLTLSKLKKEPLQKTFWNKIEDHTWIESVRILTTSLIDESARNGLALTSPKQKLLEHIKKMEKDMVRITSTKGYNLLEKLRKIRRAL